MYMPIPSKYQVDFCHANIYHVFNRTNNKEILFRSDENRAFFLRQYERYLGSLLDTFCWCLMNNHFHLLVRIKSLKDINSALQQKHPDELTLTEEKFLNENCSVSELLEVAFKNMFQSYTLAFNKQHNRKGNLFYKPFKRILIDKDSQFTQAVIYVHANPQKHSPSTNFENYKWSSYQSFLSESATKVLRNELLEWFGTVEIFRSTHIKLAEHYYSDISIES
jgi:putative transposase